MKLSYAVLLLIGDSSAKHHHHRSYEPVKPNRDISDKNVDPYVYGFVNDAVNPQPLPRTATPSAKDTYTPYGNPYWPKQEEAPAAVVPAALQPPKTFAQVYDAPSKNAHKDISDKKIDPWVFEKVYDAVNPQPLTRDVGPPPKEHYTPYGNPYWPESAKTEKKAAEVPAELKGTGAGPAEIMGTGAVKALMQLSDDGQVLKKNDDISDKNVDPWVYNKVYESVNPQPLSRTATPPAKETYTPYGNPYWPTKASLAQGDENIWVNPK